MKKDLLELLNVYVDTKNEAIRDELVKKFEYIVPCTFKRIISSLPADVSASDVQQIGRLKLLKAIETYDPTTGVKFESYAITLVRRGMRKAIRQACWGSARAKEWLVDQVTRELTARLKRHPTDDEVAEELGVSEEEYGLLVQDIQAGNLSSTDQTIESEDDSDGLIIAEVISGGDDTYASVLLRKQAAIIVELVNELPEDLKSVATLLLQGYTASSISKKLAITTEEATSKVNAVRRRLRLSLSKGSNSELFAEWLSNIENKKIARKERKNRRLAAATA